MKHYFLFFILCLFSASVYCSDFSASKANNISDVQGNFLPNENGVFPVLLSWKHSGSFYKIFMYDELSGEYTFLTETESDNFIHSSDAKPLSKTQYKLCSYNSKGNLISEETDSGWGALSPETYLKIYTTMLDKTQKRLILMNKKGVLEKLGSEEIQGLVNGTLSYKTKIAGLNGIVTITYTNYQDFDDWLFDGTIITKANMAANGTVSGTVNVTGMYPGKVIYDNALLRKGVPGGGFYIIDREDFEPAEVDYKYYIVIN